MSAATRLPSHRQEPAGFAQLEGRLRRALDRRKDLVEPMWRELEDRQREPQADHRRFVDARPISS